MKKQTFTEMLNRLIENGLIVTRYQSPDNFDLYTEGVKTNIDVYVDESKFHHTELYMIPDDMIKVMEDIFITDFICILKYLYHLSGKEPSKEIINKSIEVLRRSMNICRVYNIDSDELEKLKKSTKALFDDIGTRLDNQ